MQIRLEQYGSQIGVNGNLVDLMTKKEIQILLTISADDNRSRQQHILSKADAELLRDRITSLLEDPIAKENGFRYV